MPHREQEKASFAQLEHVQAKYVGTGHSETTREEWMLTQHRDTYASLLGHHDQLVLLGTAESQSVARVRFRLLQVRTVRACPGRACVEHDQADRAAAGQVTSVQGPRPR